ncbi:hypothetical protein LTR17_003787 [Elasticomyces elasticus]|nr:hypothetical protein LTR17_003787 [Elasticomyces elasticus]
MASPSPLDLHRTWTTEDRVKDVSGLYGPGSYGCWLLIVCSVFVSWTVNCETRRTDGFTNDLLGTLSLPVVAAGHLMYQLIWYQGDTKEIFLPSTPDAVARTGTIEASLAVCETFSALALFLFMIAGPRRHYKRCAAVAIAGFLTFSMKCALFGLSQPTLPHGTLIVSLFVVGAGTMLVVYVYHVNDTNRAPAEAAPTARKNKIMGPEDVIGLGPLSRPGDIGEVPIAGGNLRAGGEPTRVVEATSILSLAERQQRPQSGAGKQRLKTLIMTLMMYLTLMVLSAGWSGNAPAVASSLIASQIWGWRSAFFIPLSDAKLNDIDQAFALACGACTLLFSVWEAWKSRGIPEHEQGGRRRHDGDEATFSDDDP